MPPRRFPPPWSVEEPEVCFIVRTLTGRRWPTSISRRSREEDAPAAHLLTRDEARRIAANIAKLAELLSK